MVRAMTTMIAEVYDALKSAGADDDKARAAAEAVAVQQRETTDLREEVRTGFAEVRARLAMLQWMIGGIGFGVVLLIIESFWPAL